MPPLRNELRPPSSREGLTLTSALGLNEKEVICIVGAGGKTTTMFRLARELSLKKKVVTTTTTRILEPSSTETPFFFVDADAEKSIAFIRRHIDEFRHITVAAQRLGEGKVKGITSDAVLDLWASSLVDYLIIEADGAAGRPIKAPREQEPVIPSNTTLVVGILGIDAVGMELGERSAFQAERISTMTGIPLGGRIDAGGMATLMTHPDGIFKGAPASARLIPFINKVDEAGGLAAAEEVAEEVLRRRHPQIERVVLGQAKKEPPVVNVLYA